MGKEGTKKERPEINGMRVRKRWGGSLRAVKLGKLMKVGDEVPEHSFGLPFFHRDKDAFFEFDFFCIWGGFFSHPSKVRRSRRTLKSPPLLGPNS